MTTPDRIPSDLALEIDAALSPQRFLGVTRAFFGYVDEVTASVLADPGAVTWSVVVREGSALIGLRPNDTAAPETLQHIYRKVEDGIVQMSKGRLGESGLGEAALKHLGALAEFGAGAGGKSAPVRLWVKRRPLVFTVETARAVEDDWRVDYHDYGAVEGRLEMIQDNAGRLQLRLRDSAVGQTVTCRFPDHMLDDVFANFRRRVEVSGVIHYRSNGTAISIDVDRIERLPDDDELPSAEDVRGILKVHYGRRADLLG